MNTGNKDDIVVASITKVKESVTQADAEEAERLEAENSEETDEENSENEKNIIEIIVEQRKFKNKY